MKSLPSSDNPCPCHSNLAYQSCCEPYHAGTQPAPDATALMRSRYSAYALGLADYILLTTHRENVQARRNFKAWRAEVLAYCQATQFLGLAVLDSAATNATTATVTFRASLSRQGTPFTMTEKSTFVKIGARWLYHSGETTAD